MSDPRSWAECAAAPGVRQVVDEDDAVDLLIEHAAQGPVPLMSSCATASVFACRPALGALADQLLAFTRFPDPATG